MGLCQPETLFVSALVSQTQKKTPQHSEQISPSQNIPLQQILERNTWVLFFLITWHLVSDTFILKKKFFFFFPSWKILTDLCFFSH